MLRTCVMACFGWALFSWMPTAFASDGCPRLPDGHSLRWEQRDVPGMEFCKALDGADGTELFSVTLGGSLPFRPVGSLQAGRGSIGGHKVRWYRGSDGFAPDVVLRETLVRLGRGRDAHVVVRALSEEVLQQRLLLVEDLRFDPAG